MKTFTLSRNQLFKTSFLMFTLAVAMVANAQRNYSAPIFSANVQGGQTMFGNTNMAIYSSGTGLTGGTVNTNDMNNVSNVSNESSNMQFVDVDYTSGNAGGVTNASTASLVLPTSGTNTILFARLYWGGRYSPGAFTPSQLENVSIRKGTSGSYINLTAPASQLDTAKVSVGTGTAYQGWYDVTSFIQSNGAGAYTVANIKASTGSDASGIGNYAGWTIVVAYQNSTMAYYSIRIYDAFLQVKSGGAASTVTLTNFNAPNNTLAVGDATLSTLVWEGDNYYSGDYLKINGATYSDAINPSNNMWNSTISQNGSYITTGNPYFKNNMGIDIDQIQVGGSTYGINPGATSVQIQFGTSEDEYYCSVFAFSIRMQDPTLTIVKTVAGNLYPYNVLQAKDTLTYNISGQNTGAGIAANVYVVDSLPAGITYLPNTLQIVTSPGTGMTGAKSDASGDDQAQYVPASGNARAYVKFFVGTGATSTSGGSLNPNDSYNVQFKVYTPSNANQLISVTNIADIYAQGSIVGSVSNEASVFITPTKSHPISLLSFTASKEGEDVLVKWATSSELNNAEMIVERSEDGTRFEALGSVEGNGTTALEHSYQYTDMVSNLTGTVFYRLRSIDNNGANSLSQVIAINLEGNSLSSAMSVFPNPFVSEIKVNVNSDKEKSGNIVISNIAGQPVYRQAVTLQNGQNILVISNLGGLKPGVYVINLVTEEGRSVLKIVKN